MTGMAGYTKLFNSILASTIWRAGKETKLLWITMLAMADKDGVAAASVPGLAHFAGLSMAETEAGLAELSAPDEHSRTKDHEGRRIEAVDGGWKIINHAKYRERMGVDERRQYKAQKQREYRERDRGQKVDKRSTRGRGGHNTEAEADTKAEAGNTYLPSVPGTSTALCVEDAEKVDRLDAEIAFEESRFNQLALPIRDDIQRILDGLPRAASRSPFSASRWLRTGLTGIGRSENALTVLRLTNDALEAHQRAHAAPIISDSNRQTLETIKRVGDRMRQQRGEAPREITG